MVAYTNQTVQTYSHVTIQCVGFSDNEIPIGQAQEISDVRLGDLPIQSGKTRYYEMSIRHGGFTIEDVKCSVVRAKP